MAQGLSTSGLSISEAAQKVRLSAHTLRYYERIGLLEPVGRVQGDRRRYSPEDLARIEFFNRLRTTGMPIRKMQAFAELARQGEATVPARRQALEEHRQSVIERIAELQTHLNALERKISYYRQQEDLQKEQYDQE